MYDKLVKFYSIGTQGKNLSLRNQLYRIRKSEHEDITTYLMKISQIGDYLKGLEEVVTGFEMTICVLNSLPPNWSSFVTNIYTKKDTALFDEF